MYVPLEFGFRAETRETDPYFSQVGSSTWLCAGSQSVRWCGGGDEGVTGGVGAQSWFWWGSWGDAAHVSPSLDALEKFQLLACGFLGLGLPSLLDEGSPQRMMNYHVEGNLGELIRHNSLWGLPLCLAPWSSAGDLLFLFLFFNHLFVFGYAEFLLLLGHFASSELGLLSSHGARARHRSGFSCCRALAIGRVGFGSFSSQALQHSLRSCGTQAQVHAWALKHVGSSTGRSGIELVWPVLTGNFFITEPPGKPLCFVFFFNGQWHLLLSLRSDPYKWKQSKTIF